MDEDDREEDHVPDYDEHNGDGAPLEFENSADATVSLAGCESSHGGGVGRESGAICCGGVVEERFDVDVYAIDHCCQLDD